MKVVSTLVSLVAAVVVLGFVAPAAAQVGTAFTYQGDLRSGGVPANGTFNLTFRLFGAASGGTQVGSAVSVFGAPVTDGQFTVQLDFGASAFTGSPRWLEIVVNGVVLSPRQPITPAPYALHAETGGDSPWQTNGTRVYYTGGNVGIGTTAPNVDLEINGDEPGILMINQTETVMGLLMADAQAFSTENASILYDAAARHLQFSLNGAERMRIAPTGMGIGTTTPGADVHIRGAGALGQLLVTPNVADSSAQLMLTENTSASLGAILRYDGAANQFQVLGQNSGASAPQLVVGRDNGRVGIGAAVPATLLDVQGAGTTAGGNAGFNEVVARFLRPVAGGHSAVAIDAETGQDAIMYFAENGAAQWSIRTDHISDFLYPQLNIRYQRGGRNDTALRFTGSDTGVIGIYPGLDDNVVLGSLVGGAWQTIVTRGFLNTSDARKKQDVRNLDYGLSEILRLRPVRFRWKSRPEDGDRLGVIAQEVQTVMPDIVHSERDDPEQTLGVDYIALVPVLIRGVQEQQEKIDALERQNESLEARLAELEALVRGGGVTEMSAK